MKYWKLDRNMQKSGVEYSIEQKDALVQIETEPEKNDVAQKNIETALGKGETCINSSQGKFSIIQTNVRIYKKPREESEELES